MALRRFNILSLLFLAGFLLCFTSNAQEIPVQLEQALTTANVKNLSRHFDDRVDIVMDGEGGDYSEQQAQVVLNEFLSKLEDIHYELIHQETSKNHSTYYIGKLTSTGSVFRVYVNVKQVNGKDFIQAIKFEKQ